MDNIIIVKKLNCSYGEKQILKNVNFDIKKGDFVSIVGPSGCGKSTLAKLLLGLIPFEGYVNVCNMNICQDNLAEIRKMIGIVFENPDNYFVVDTVEDELAFALENLNLPPQIIHKKIEEIVAYLDIEHLLKKSISQLSGGEKQLVALASVLVQEPKILVLDEAFTMVDGESHRLLLKLIKKIHQDKKMTVINITDDMNDTIYGNEIIVLNKGNVIFEGKKEILFEDEKKLKSIGLNLPFIVDLSKKLGYYGLTDKIIWNMNQMVKQLWK